MKLEYFFNAVGLFLVLKGIWILTALVINIKGYYNLKEDYDTFFDFCCDYYSDSKIWQLRKKLGLRKFYNSKLFIVLRVFLGILILCLGILVWLGVLWIMQSEYADYLLVEF